MKYSPGCFARDIAQPVGGRGGAFEKGGGVEGDVRHCCRRNLITSSSERTKIFFVCSEKFLFLFHYFNWKKN